MIGIKLRIIIIIIIIIIINYFRNTDIESENTEGAKRTFSIFSSYS